MQILVKLLPLLFASAYAFASPESLSIERPKDLPFYLISVKVMDQDVKMLLDTGASSTVLGEWFVSGAKLPLSDQTGSGKDAAGNAFNMALIKTCIMQVGHTKKEMAPVPVVPLPSMFADHKIAGIFSPQTFFNNESIAIDFRDSRFLVGDEAMKLGKVIAAKVPVKPCSSKTPDKYLVDLKVNGVSGTFYLDTGGIRSAATKTFSEKLPNTRVQSSGERIGVASKRKVDQIDKVQLKIGDIEDQSGLDIEPGKVSCPAADGKLGIDWLSKFALLFNPARSELTLYR